MSDRMGVPEKAGVGAVVILLLAAIGAICWFWVWVAIEFIHAVQRQDVGMSLTLGGLFLGLAFISAWGAKR